MIRKKCLLISTLFLPLLSYAADPKWIQMQDENFRVYSSASEGDTRRALNNLERVRSFFIQASGTTPPKPVPIYVVMFGSEKDYEPFKPNEVAVAYYSSGTDRDYIVMNLKGQDSARVATHEYTHLIMRHAGYTLPPWLNEGIAELYSTLKSVGNSTELGDVILGRLQALSTQPWVPLETILSADASSPYYNESNKAGNLYNQSWALVHMLATTKEYLPEFWDVVDQVQKGVPSTNALEQAYGIPFAAIENQAKNYVRSSSFNKLVTKIKITDMEKMKGTPANLYDVRLLQADLLANQRKGAEDARVRYEELSREDASRPEPWSGLAYLAWRASKPENAIGYFAKAYDAGDRNARLLLDYGRLAAGKDPVRAMQVLDQYLQTDPKSFDARLTLASLQSSQQQYAAALTTLKAITSVKTEAERDRVLLLRANVALRGGERIEARARAEELKRVTKDELMQSRADDMLRYLDQVERQGTLVSAAPPRPIQPPADPELEARPVLRQRHDDQRESRPATRSDMEIILQDARGTLVEMDCGDPARMLLQTETGVQAFLVLQPDRLIVTGGAPGAPAEFTCGKQQKPAQMRIQFTIAPEGSTAAGVVRAVHFQN